MNLSTYNFVYEFIYKCVYRSCIAKPYYFKHMSQNGAPLHQQNNPSCTSSKLPSPTFAPSNNNLRFSPSHRVQTVLLEEMEVVNPICLMPFNSFFSRLGFTLFVRYVPNQREFFGGKFRFVFGFVILLLPRNVPSTDSVLLVYWLY